MLANEGNHLIKPALERAQHRVMPAARGCYDGMDARARAESRNVYDVCAFEVSGRRIIECRVGWSCNVRMVGINFEDAAE